MRTTIELPDELFREAKVRAAREGKKLKELVREYVEQGLRQRPGAGAKPARPRSPLPVVRLATDRPLASLSNADLFAILEAEELTEGLDGPP